MIVAATGKIVIDFEVYTAGDEIDGLTPEAEENLVSLGLAVYADLDGCEAKPDEGGEQAPLSYDELKERCRELGISARGKKADLEARIAEAEAQTQSEEPDDSDDADLEYDELEDEEPPELTAEVPR